MKIRIVIILIAILILIACTKQPANQQNNLNTLYASARIYPTQGNNVSGAVTFANESNGIHVVARLEGLSPGPHGFHIHEFGNCSSPKGTSAGGHFNPENTSHGAPTSEVRHIGDLGNIIADETGIAYLNWTDTKISFEGPNSIIGKSVIIHEKEDDLKTQPTGAAGARLGCGIIYYNDNIPE